MSILQQYIQASSTRLFETADLAADITVPEDSQAEASTQTTIPVESTSGRLLNLRNAVLDSKIATLQARDKEITEQLGGQEGQLKILNADFVSKLGDFPFANAPITLQAEQSKIRAQIEELQAQKESSGADQVIENPEEFIGNQFEKAKKNLLLELKFQQASLQADLNELNQQNHYDDRERGFFNGSLPFSNPFFSNPFSRGGLNSANQNPRVEKQKQLQEIQEKIKEIETSNINDFDLSSSVGQNLAIGKINRFLDQAEQINTERQIALLQDEIADLQARKNSNNGDERERGFFNTMNPFLQFPGQQNSIDDQIAEKQAEIDALGASSSIDSALVLPEGPSFTSYEIPSFDRSSYDSLFSSGSSSANKLGSA